MINCTHEFDLCQAPGLKKAIKDLKNRPKKFKDKISVLLLVPS